MSENIENADKGTTKKRVAIEDVERTLSLREEASRRGAMIPPLPKSTDTELDELQKNLVGYYTEKLDEEKRLAESSVQHSQNQLDELSTDIEDAGCETLVEKTQGEVNQVFVKSRQKLVSAYVAYTTNNRLFQHFRFINHLQERAADYPSSTILHWSVILVLLVGESVANSYFFAQGSSFGLLGGLLQALLVSLVNVGMALVVGRFVLPLKNKQDSKGEKTHDAIGYGLTVFLFGLILIFNLAVAHYRESISADPLAAIALAIPKLLKSPFAITNLDAWMLFILGTLSAFFAMWKSYTSDDIYPGYGAEDRKNKYYLYEFDVLKEQLRDDLLNVIRLHEAKADESKIGYRRKVRDYRNTISLCEKNYQSALSTLDYYAKACNQLLVQYREINIQTRGPASPPPSYFKETYHFDSDLIKLSPLTLEEDKNRLEKYEAASEHINSHIKDILSKLMELMDKVMSVQFTTELNLIEDEGRKIMEAEKRSQSNKG